MFRFTEEKKTKSSLYQRSLRLAKKMNIPKTMLGARWRGSTKDQWQTLRDRLTLHDTLRRLQTKRGKTVIKDFNIPYNQQLETYKSLVAKDLEIQSQAKRYRQLVQKYGLKYKPLDDKKTFEDWRAKNLKTEQFGQDRILFKKLYQNMTRADVKDMEQQAAILLDNTIEHKDFKERGVRPSKFLKKENEAFLEFLKDKKASLFIQYDDGYSESLYINSGTMDFILNLFDTTAIMNEENEWGSDWLNNFKIQQMESISIRFPQATRIIRNRDGSFFPKISIFPVNLARLQIFNQDQADSKTKNQKQCLLHSLKLNGVSDSQLNYIKLQQIDDKTDRISSIGKNQLSKIAKYLNRDIELFQKKLSDSRIYKKVYKGFSRQNEDEVKTENIKIAIYMNHYFIFEDSKLREFAVRNCQEIQGERAWKSITGKDRKERYIRKKSTKPLNTLKLVILLDELKYFIAGDMSNFINTEYHKEAKEVVFLDNIENEQLESGSDMTPIEWKLWQEKQKKKTEEEKQHIQNKIRELESKKNDPNDKKTKIVHITRIFYADNESFTNKRNESGNHRLLFIGWVSKSTKKYVKKSIDNFENRQKMIDSVLKEIRNEMLKAKAEHLKDHPEDIVELNPILYFHNLRYDLALMEPYLNITKKTQMKTTLYSVEFKFENIKFELRDSWKVLPMPLSRFNKAFKLPKDISKKEAIAYNYYNEANLNKIITTREYAKHLPHNKKNIFYDEVKKCLSYDPETKTFDPYEYYKYYLKYDCLTLMAGLEAFNKVLLKLSNGVIGAYDRLTISSLADTFVSKNGAYRGIFKMTGNLRKYVGKAIKGGRVYANDDYIGKVMKKLMIAIDACSLYPSAIFRLSEKYGLPLGHAKNIRTDEFHKWKSFDYCILTIKITKVNKKCNVPLITTYREDGRLLYSNNVPNEETTVDKYTLEDYIEHHKIEFDIIKGVKWDEGSTSVIGPLIEKLYDDRHKAKATGKYGHLEANKPMNTTLKLMLNSIYGKNMLKASKDKLVFHNENKWNKKLRKMEFTPIDNYICSNYSRIISSREFRPNQYEIKERCSDDSFNQAHIGCMILSMSKRIMNELFKICEKVGADVSYQDTDSCHIPKDKLPEVISTFEKEYGRLLCGESMGQFNEDFELAGAEKGSVCSIKSVILAPKVYYDKLEGRTKEGKIVTGEHYRWKGATPQGLEYAAKEYGGMFELYKKAISEPIRMLLNPHDQETNETKEMFDFIRGKVRTKKDYYKTFRFNKK